MPFRKKYDQAAYARKYYLLHRDKIIRGNRAVRRRARRRARQFVNAYLETHPCVECGETKRVRLDFDHVPELGTKRREISIMVNLGFSIVTIAREIAKCEVRCANHHRDKTAERRRENQCQPVDVDPQLRLF